MKWVVRRPAFALLVLVLVAFVPGAGRALGQSPPPQPVDPGIGIRLLEAPESRRDDPRARRYIIDHVNPGTSFSRNFEVTNGTDRDVVVNLYAAAATLKDGEFVPASGHTANELSGWMRIDPPTLSIAKGGRAQAKIIVAVPGDAANGERYAVALAELPPPPGAGLVGLASRVGIRVYLSVGTGSEPGTDFALKTFEPIIDGTRPGVSIHSCNTGGRAIDLGGSLTLSDGPGGISAGPFKSSQPSTVAPGDCEDLKILLDPKLPRGPWSATAALRSGTREKTAEAKITFPAPGQKGKAVPAHEKGTRQSPMVAGLGIAAVLAAGGLLYGFLRRRRGSARTA
jgi:hypothetical protein